jgi:Protein of unknown function (DUF4246)
MKAAHGEEQKHLPIKMLTVPRHIEGALNEHICATALYYYDEENLTESSLAFRQTIDSEDMMMVPGQVWTNNGGCTPVDFDAD